MPFLIYSFIVIFTFWSHAVISIDRSYSSTVKEVIKNRLLSISRIPLTIVIGTTVKRAEASESLQINDIKSVSTPTQSPQVNPGGDDATFKQEGLIYSDEFLVTFSAESLGISLVETMYKGFPVVTVKTIRDENVGTSNPLLRPGAIVVRVGQNNCDGLSLKSIYEMIKSSPRPLTIKFRDPSRFFELLDSCGMDEPPRFVTTQYLPANTRDAGAKEQVISVERLDLPPFEDRRRSSQLYDVLEIQYVAQILGSTKIVDSSAERAPPGTSTKSIYYILGEQNGPPGKYPQGNIFM